MLDRLLRALGVPSFAEALPHQRVLAILVIAVAVLFVLGVLFAVIAVALRTGHARALRRASQLEEQWHDQLLDVIGGSAPPEAIQARVAPGAELEFLSYLLRFARRLRGGESNRLATVAAPFLDRAVAELRDRSPERRAHAVQALAAFGMERYGAAVLEMLDDPSPYVAVTAAQALATREHAEHAPHVLRRLRRFPHWSADYLSAMIARIGPVAAEPARALLSDDAQPAATRAIAADVLRRLNDPDAADVAARVLAQRGGGRWTAAALQAACLGLLAQVGGGRPVHAATARTYAGSPHSIVRGAAVRALATLGGDAETPTLRDALDDQSPHVAQEAARGLLSLGRTDVLRDVAAEHTATALVARQVLAEGERGPR